jgi:hypothetical protein
MVISAPDALVLCCVSDGLPSFIQIMIKPHPVSHRFHCTGMVAALA